MVKRQRFAEPSAVASTDADGLASAFLVHKSELTSFIRGRVGDADLADDLVQDVFIRATRNPDAGAIASPRAFLFTIAANLVRDVFRRRQVRREADLKSVDWVAGVASETPEAALLAQEESERVRKVFLAASQRQQAVFALHWRHGLKYAEIAERLGISVRTVEREMAGIVKKMLLELEG